jgi:ABC-type Fe3+/spermidine/putrescine transport system ATPase subunit
VPEGARAIVAARPERIQLGPANQPGATAGTVADTNCLGNAWRATVRLADGREYLTLQQIGRAEAASLKRGQAMSIS